MCRGSPLTPPCIPPKDSLPIPLPLHLLRQQRASTRAPGHCDMVSVAIYLCADKDNKSSSVYQEKVLTEVRMEV